MAFDSFLKIDGVKGESMDSVYAGAAGWIDILSFTYGVTQTGSASSQGGLTAGKANLQDFTFTQKVHIGSPEMFIRCCTGKYCKNANMIARKAAGAKAMEFLKIDMDNVLITSVTAQGAGGPDEIPTETVALTAEQMSVYYAEQKEDGTKKSDKKVTFNQKKNTAEGL